jgi:hypothetical protein
LKYLWDNFALSLIFTLAALILAGWLGYSGGGLWAGAFSMIFLAAVLGVMETSLSLDNAVVNASVLKDMDPVWQQRFLTWGILIAVFGMRIVFPVLIVAFAAWVSPWEAVTIAISDRELYEETVTNAHIGISGFGGVFLLLVGLTFFFDEDREHLWLAPIEKPLAFLARIPLAPYLFTAAALGGLCLLVEGADRTTFLIAGFSGLATYFAVSLIGTFLDGDVDEATGQVARSGAGGFIYLEFLDASFSFDGVIGAFAITNDILLIALGLGIGAMFVRSMTIALVKGGTLTQFRFLESGAFYAIIGLACIMLASIRFHVPEVVTGLLGATIIGIALWHSVLHKKRFPELYAEPGDAEAILPSSAALKDIHTQ